MTNFLSEYSRVVAEAIPANFPDNHDLHRFGPEQVEAGQHSLALAVRGKLARMGLITVGAARQTIGTGMHYVAPHLQELEWLYSQLPDEESKEILVKIMAFRALGHKKIKLPLNHPDHWDRVQSVKKLAEQSESVPSGFMHFNLARLNLRGFGYPIEMFFDPHGIVATFIEQQYRCETPDGAIECADGDVAIDAGGCWGDTALYLAHKVGEHGKVASFEFLSDNIKFFRKNLDLNPELASRIRLHQHPVWSSSGEELYISGIGPGTSVGSKETGGEALKVKTMSIDDLVLSGDLERADFIKMDIEGSELAALQGAEQTLRRFKPKLAITVYHDLKDFWTIPQYLHQLGLGYRFYLRHFSIHAEETVLFAKA